MRETTALGAAIAAGLAAGLWRNFAELRDINRAGGAVFEPQVSREQSAQSFALWEKAVHMCRGWVGDKAPPSVKEEKPEVPESLHTSDALTIPLSKTYAEITLPRAPLINLSSNLDDADEDDLYLELRKVEILQRLKKLAKLKLTYM